MGLSGLLTLRYQLFFLFSILFLHGVKFPYLVFLLDQLLGHHVTKGERPYLLLDLFCDFLAQSQFLVALLDLLVHPLYILLHISDFALEDLKFGVVLFFVLVLDDD